VIYLHLLLSVCEIGLDQFDGDPTTLNTLNECVACSEVIFVQCSERPSNSPKKHNYCAVCNIEVLLCHQ
jgi:hypothetical protein